MDKLPLRKIISGGQTGADQGALEAAKILGLETGGWMPKGFKTEDTRRPQMAEEYGMKEHSSPGYRSKAGKNISEADGTAIFGDPSFPGCSLALDLCKGYGADYVVNPDYRHLRQWLEESEIEILNVAGNRESKNPGLQERVRAVIIAAINQESFA